MSDTPRNPPSMFVEPEARGVVRARYLPGQALSWQDLTVDQDYHTIQRRSVNRYGLGFTGVMHGLEVTLDGQNAIVSAGMAIDGWGREILLVSAATLSLADLDPGQSDGVFYVSIAYYEFTRVYGPPGQERSYARTVESPHVYWSAEQPLSPLDGILLAKLQRKSGKLEVIRSTDNGRTLIGRRVLFSDAQTQDSAVGCAITLAGDGRSLLVDGAMSITPLPSVESAGADRQDDNSAPVFSVKARAQGSAEPTDALTLSGSGDLALTGMVQWSEPEKVTLQIGPRVTQPGDPTGFSSPQLQLKAPALYLDGAVWVDIDGTPTPLADAGYWKLDSAKQVLYYGGNVDVRGAGTSGSVQLRPTGVSTFSNALVVTGSGAFGAAAIESGWSLYAAGGAAIAGSAGPDKLALDVQGAVHLSGATGIAGALTVTSTTESHFAGPLRVSGALNLDGTTETSQVAGNLTIQGLLRAGNVQLQDAASLQVAHIESDHGPLSVTAKGGVEIRAQDGAGSNATLSLLSADGGSTSMLEAHTGGQTCFRVDPQGQTWSAPRSGPGADLATFARLVGGDGDRLTLDMAQLSGLFPAKTDHGLVDLPGLIAPLVQAIANLAGQVEHQSNTSSSLLGQIAEIAKVVEGLPIR